MPFSSDGRMLAASRPSLQTSNLLPCPSMRRLTILLFLPASLAVAQAIELKRPSVAEAKAALAQFSSSQTFAARTQRFL